MDLYIDDPGAKDVDRIFDTGMGLGVFDELLFGWAHTQFWKVNGFAIAGFGNGGIIVHCALYRGSRVAIDGRRVCCRGRRNRGRT